MTAALGQRRHQSAHPDLAEILENAILEYTDIEHEQYVVALDWQQQIREAA